MQTEGAMQTGLNTSRCALDLKDEKDFLPCGRFGAVEAATLLLGIPWDYSLVKLSFSRRKPSSYSARWMTAFLPCGWLGHDDSRLTAGAIDKRNR